MNKADFYITSEDGYWYVKIGERMEKYGSAEEAAERVIGYSRTVVGRRDFRRFVLSCPNLTADDGVKFGGETDDNMDIKRKAELKVKRRAEFKAERQAQREQELIRKARKALKDLADAEAGLK